MRCNAPYLNRYNKYRCPQGYQSSTNEGVFQFFKDSFFNSGNPVHFGINWFFTGLNRFSGPFGRPHSDATAGFLAEVLGKDTNLCEYHEYPSAKLLTDKIKEALSSKKSISVVHNYAGIAHAINVWGAEFDANGRITHLYTTDNNDGDLESNKAPRTPAGLLKCAVEERGGEYVFGQLGG